MHHIYARDIAHLVAVVLVLLCLLFALATATG
jgi:hypothetical protein